MAFNRKKIRITLKLNGEKQSFISQNANKLSATGLKVSADITYGNGALIPNARVKVYGLPQEVMNKLIFLKWRQVQTLRNEITVEATDDNDTFITVFKGGIISAIPDYAESPNVSITIDALTNAYHVKNTTKAESYEGIREVKDIVKGICDRLEYRFEPNNVDEKIENAYLQGSDMEKIRSVCLASNVNVYIEDKSVAIAKQGTVRQNKIAVLSPTTGLIGYPIPVDTGVMLRCLFNPNIVFGGLIIIKDSLVELVNGAWRVYGIRTILETETESGRWFSEISAANKLDKNKPIQK